MLIDTHSHLNFVAFEKDRKEVIKKCLEHGICMINVGTDFKTSKMAVEIAKKYEKGVYAAIGLHPMNLDTGLIKMKADENEGSHFEKEFDYEKYKNLVVGKNLDSIGIENLAKFEKVVAIGEIGLDYYYRPKTTKKKELFKQKQKDLLLKQLDLAKELNLPVILHCRMALDDLIEILKSNVYCKTFHLRGVIHCFTGNWEQAKKILELGFYIGFNGIIFKLKLDEIIKKTLLDKILLETDCPYLTPQNFLEKRNNPLGVKYIAEYIAKIKKMNFEKVAEITTQNAKELFKI